MVKNNTGRSIQVKEAFARYLLSGIDEFLPLTPALERYIQRDRKFKLMVCPSRMIDDVQDMLNTYRRSNDETGRAIDSPLPVIFLAFAKETAPIPTDRGRSVADPQTLKLSKDSEFYRVRMQHKEWRCQLAFIAHEHETAQAMTDQLRLFIQRFENHRWKIDWHHDGIDFQTTCTLEEGFEPADMVVDVDGGRKNSIIYTWDLNLNFILPFVDEVPVRVLQNETTKVQVNAGFKP